jgi:general stress protein CsbA
VIELKKLFDVLKDISALVVGAAAFLYALGYTVHLAYFRLLGIGTVGQPLDYVRLAADYVASIVSSLPLLLLAAPFYLPTLFRAPFWILTILCMAMIVGGIVVGYSARSEKERAWKSLGSADIALSLLTIVALALLLRLELDIAKVRDVLQTADLADIQQMQNQLANPEIQKWDNKKLFDWKKKNVGRVYSKYASTHHDTPGFYYWNEWFNPTADPGNSNRRRTAYLALLLINLVVFVCAMGQLVWLSRSRQKQTKESRPSTHGTKLKEYWKAASTVALALGLLSQLFVFPYIYATLGRSFLFPVVKFRVAHELRQNSRPDEIPSPSAQAEKGSSASTADLWTHGVYLVSESDTEVVVYDRLNFFQIKHVPKTRILAMSQLFNASPFDSCDTQEMTPCETLWIPEDTSTFDF